MSNKTCLFCKIQKIKSLILVESKLFFVVQNRFQVTNGHILIISKRHAKDFFDLNKKEFEDLHEINQKAKKWLKKQKGIKGTNICINNGKEASQTVPHFHMHLIPRYGIKQEWNEHTKRNIYGEIAIGLDYYNRFENNHVREIEKKELNKN